MKDTLLMIAMAVGGLLVILAIVAVCMSLPAVVVMLAWNWVAVDLFHAPEVSFLQAWVGLILLGIIGKTLFPSRSSSEPKRGSRAS